MRRWFRVSLSLICILVLGSPMLAAWPGSAAHQAEIQAQAAFTTPPTSLFLPKLELAL